MFRALKFRKIPTVMVRFPNESHELSRSGQPWHRVERLQHIVGWFDHWLKGIDNGVTADPRVQLFILGANEWRTYEDWPLAEAKCVETLQSHSKDFQVAAWLCEAWIHLHQVEGFIAGASLLAGMVEKFWDSAHPQIEDGDDDARAAPFIWINENLPVTLLLNMISATITSALARYRDVS